MRCRHAGQVLQAGQAVVAAQAAVVLEQIERQAQRHRLGQDRQINARDAAAKRQPAKDQRKDARNQDHKGQLQHQTVGKGPDQRKLTAAHDAEYLVADGLR